MKRVSVYRKGDGLVLGNQVDCAQNFFDRSKGLLGREGLKDGEGLLIEKCNSVHTFFMKFPITVVFLNKNNQVVHVLEKLPPWRVTRIYWSARKVLELPVSEIGKRISIGDFIEVKCIS